MAKTYTTIRDAEKALARETRVNIIVFLVLSFFLLISLSASGQTCSQAAFLREGVCPVGITSCTVNDPTDNLSHTQLNATLINAVNLCNGPGKFTWPATGVAGIFAVSSGGVVSVAVDDDTPDSDSEVPDAHTMSGGTLSGTNTVTGILNLDSGTEGTLRYPTSTTLPATCTLGDSYWDTDGDTDGSLYICRATNTWKEVDDDGGAGGGAPVDPTYLTLGTNATLTNERVFTPGIGLDLTDAGAGSTYTLFLKTSDTLAANPSLSSEDVVFTKDGAGGGLLFEGTTADAFEGILVWNPSGSDKTMTIPDANGTLISNVDSGTVSTAMVANDAITEAKLKVVDSPADEECFTYESTTGDFEWQSCGSGGSPTALPRVSARLTADQSITTSTDTPIAFNTEVVDQGGFHDNVTNNSRFTVPTGEDGTYIADCGMLIQQGTNERILRIRKNGTTIVAEDKDGGISNTGINMGMTASVVLELVATDYTECVVFHAHGSNISVRTDERTHGSLTKMR